MPARNLIVRVVVPSLLLVHSAGAQDIVFDDPFDQTGNGYLSQNDPVHGKLAQVYSRWTIPHMDDNAEFDWVGARFGSGRILGWTVTLFANFGGTIGWPFREVKVSGDANEQFVGAFGGSPCFAYSVRHVDLFDFSDAWISVVPDLDESEGRWYWCTGTLPGYSFIDENGSRTQIDSTMALTVRRDPVPEPNLLCLAMLGISVARKVLRLR